MRCVPGCVQKEPDAFAFMRESVRGLFYWYSAHAGVFSVFVGTVVAGEKIKNKKVVSNSNSHVILPSPPLPLAAAAIEG